MSKETPYSVLLSCELCSEFASMYAGFLLKKVIHRRKWMLLDDLFFRDVRTIVARVDVLGNSHLLSVYRT